MRNKHTWRRTAHKRLFVYLFQTLLLGLVFLQNPTHRAAPQPSSTFYTRFGRRLNGSTGLRGSRDLHRIINIQNPLTTLCLPQSQENQNPSNERYQNLIPKPEEHFLFKIEPENHFHHLPLPWCKSRGACEKNPHHLRSANYSIIRFHDFHNSTDRKQGHYSNAFSIDSFKKECSNACREPNNLNLEKPYSNPLSAVERVCTIPH